MEIIHNLIDILLINQIEIKFKFKYFIYFTISKDCATQYLL